MEIIVVILAVIGGLFVLTVLFGAPFVPTHQRQLDKLAKELKLGQNDVLVDLGSGDGRVLKTFAKSAGRVIGYEINPLLVLIAKIRCRKLKNVEIRLADWRLAKLSPGTTVVYIFYADSFKKSLARVLEQHSNITVVSYGFELDILGKGRPQNGFYIHQI